MPVLRTQLNIDRTVTFKKLDSLFMSVVSTLQVLLNNQYSLFKRIGMFKKQHSTKVNIVDEM